MAKEKNVSLRNRAVIYVRVSSKDQEFEGFSIPAQRKALLEYAVHNNYTVVKEFSDSETAKKAGRLQFNAMIEFVKNDPSIGHILVEKTDRLLRNMKDYVLINDIMNDYDVWIHLTKENAILTQGSSGSNEEFIFGIKALMAKRFSDNLSEEVRKGMTEKAEQGTYPSGAPYGYINVRENDKSTIVVDPFAAPIVRKMFELYSSGNYSLLTLRKQMIADGMIYKNGKPFYTSTLETILKNEFYVGVFHWNGKQYDNAQHEPLVSRELFQLVQNILRNPRKNKSKRGLFPFSNLLSCGVCGCALTGEIQKEKYIYYRCTGYKGKCGQPYLKQEVLEDHFTALLGNLQIDDETQTIVLQQLNAGVQEKLEYRKALVEQFSKQIELLSKRIDAIYDDKITGAISSELWKRKSSAWQEEKDVLVIKLAEMQRSDEYHLHTAAAILELAKRAADMFVSQPADQKRRMITILVSNSSYRDGKIDVVLKPVFQELLVSSKTGNWCARQDSNLRPAD